VPRHSEAKALDASRLQDCISGMAGFAGDWNGET
jgi:hypothetical protein